MLDKAQEYHEALVEAVAEQDDALLEYFSGEPLGIDEIKACIRKATIQNRMVRSFADFLPQQGVQNCWTRLWTICRAHRHPFNQRGGPEHRQGD